MRDAFLALLLFGATQGALEQLAEAVAAQAQAAHAEAPLAVAVSAPGRPALQQAFSTLLLSKLVARGLGPALLPSSTDAEVLARARGARTLLRLHLTLDSTLAAAGDVLSSWDNLFSGRAARPPSPAAVVFAEVAPDAAVLALGRRSEAQGLQLLPGALAQWTVRTAALACGDLDGDGRDEVAVLTEEAVEVRASDGRLLARRGLEGLPRADVPPREAFGALTVCQGLLYAYSARASAGEVLALEAGALVVRGRLVRPVVACGKPPLEASFLPGVARLIPAGPGWPASPGGPLAWGLFAVHPNQPQPAWLYLLEDGTARQGRGTGPWRSFPDVGAGAALAAVHGDATLQLAASSSAPWPTEDTLRLLGLADGAESGRLPVPGRILQVAPATLEVGGAQALVLGVWRPDGGAELRVVRSLP